MLAKPGELRARLGERALTFRLTFDGIARIETRLDAGILEIAEKFPARRISSQDVIAILTEALAGAGNAIGEAELGELVLKAGFLEAARLAGLVLMRGLGVETEEKKSPPAHRAPETNKPAACPGDG
jgi:hypothetical protein